MHGGVRERGRRSSSRTLLIIDRERGDGEREEGERDKERDQEGRLRSGEAAASTSTATAIRSSAMGTARSEVGNARNNNSSSSSSSSNSSSMSPTPPLHVDSLPPWHQFISLCSSISSSYSPYSRSPVPSSLSPSSSFPLFLPHSSLPSTKACDWPASPLEAYVALSKLAAADWWKRVEVVLMTERGGEERGREGERERERERERGRGGARCREESLERINQVGKEEEREGCERGAAHNQQQQQQQQQRPPLSLLAIMCYKRGEEPDKVDVVVPLSASRALTPAWLSRVAKLAGTPVDKESRSTCGFPGFASCADAPQNAAVQLGGRPGDTGSSITNAHGCAEPAPCAEAPHKPAATPAGALQGSPVCSSPGGPYQENCSTTANRTDCPVDQPRHEAPQKSVQVSRPGFSGCSDAVALALPPSSSQEFSAPVCEACCCGPVRAYGNSPYVRPCQYQLMKDACFIPCCMYHPIQRSTTLPPLPPIQCGLLL
ncbi:hypothetical protein CLOP_g24231 [Closterium sp. NIES-67]|nr:hypothetical protein CLOP_g24231 [Closterium sp. NIES-67]